MHVTLFACQIATSSRMRSDDWREPVTCSTAYTWWVGCYIWYSEEGPRRAASPLSLPRCTKCNSPPINGQCTNFILFDVALA